jgi:hypothetical protein
MPTQITVGDLRKELAPQKPQAIHPGLNDEDLLPRFKLGFDAKNAKNAKPASAISKLDFKQIITMPVMAKLSLNSRRAQSGRVLFHRSN